MELREVSTLPLAPSVVENLLKNGFRVLRDLQGLRPMELAQGERQRCAGKKREEHGDSVLMLCLCLLCFCAGKEANITPQEALEVLNAINSSAAAPASAEASSRTSAKDLYIVRVACGCDFAC
jgi:hypothetical protein